MLLDTSWVPLAACCTFREISCVAEVMATIRQLKQHGLSIVLLEQNARLVLDVADDIVVLDSGRVAVDAATDTLQRDGVDLHQHLGIF
jgi:branched-chain amino acid transport system ATP-binding protein